VCRATEAPLLLSAGRAAAAVCRAAEAPLLLSADRAAAVCRATEAPLLLSADRAAAVCAVLLKHHCCWPPAVQQLIDISCLPGPQQQTRHTLMQWSIARQTDGRTDRHLTVIQTQQHTMQAVSITARFYTLMSCHNIKLYIFVIYISDAASRGAVNTE